MKTEWSTKVYIYTERITWWNKISEDLKEERNMVQEKVVLNSVYLSF